MSTSTTYLSGFASLRVRPGVPSAIKHEVRRCECGTKLSRYNQGPDRYRCQDAAAEAEFEAAMPVAEALLGVPVPLRQSVPLAWLIEDFSLYQIMAATGITRWSAHATKQGARELTPDEEARLRAYTGPARKCAGVPKGYKHSRPRQAKEVTK